MPQELSDKVKERMSLGVSPISKDLDIPTMKKPDFDPPSRNKQSTTKSKPKKKVVIKGYSPELYQKMTQSMGGTPAGNAGAPPPAQPTGPNYGLQLTPEGLQGSVNKGNWTGSVGYNPYQPEDTGSKWNVGVQYNKQLEGGGTINIGTPDIGGTFNMLRGLDRAGNEIGGSPQGTAVERQGAGGGSGPASTPVAADLNRTEPEKASGMYRGELNARRGDNMYNMLHQDLMSSRQRVNRMLEAPWKPQAPRSTFGDIKQYGDEEMAHIEELKRQQRLRDIEGEEETQRDRMRRWVQTPYQPSYNYY